VYRSLRLIPSILFERSFYFFSFLPIVIPLD
jgi:hypothetical protein